MVKVKTHVTPKLAYLLFWQTRKFHFSLPLWHKKHIHFTTKQTEMEAIWTAISSNKPISFKEEDGVSEGRVCSFDTLHTQPPQKVCARHSCQVWEALGRRVCWVNISHHAMNFNSVWLRLHALVSYPTRLQLQWEMHDYSSFNWLFMLLIWLSSLISY